MQPVDNQRIAEISVKTTNTQAPAGVFLREKNLGSTNAFRPTCVRPDRKRAENTEVHYNLPLIWQNFPCILCMVTLRFATKIAWIWPDFCLLSPCFCFRVDEQRLERKETYWSIRGKPLHKILNKRSHVASLILFGKLEFTWLYNIPMLLP